jgi:hypothetical protein
VHNHYYRKRGFGWGEFAGGTMMGIMVGTMANRPQQPAQPQVVYVRRPNGDTNPRDAELELEIERERAKARALELELERLKAEHQPRATQPGSGGPGTYEHASGKETDNSQRDLRGNATLSGTNNYQVEEGSKEFTAGDKTKNTFDSSGRVIRPETIQLGAEEGDEGHRLEKSKIKYAGDSMVGFHEHGARSEGEEYEFDRSDREYERSKIKYVGDSMVGFHEHGAREGEEYEFDRSDIKYEGENMVGYEKEGKAGSEEDDKGSSDDD